tara:strand:- start:1901 stop:2347 length:447 start_codon:yes stop_codon:yes gene_type:complete
MYETIARDNPSAARSLLAQRGYHIPRNVGEYELADLLRQYVRKHGKKSIIQLAKIHPDRGLIEDVINGEYEHFGGADCNCKSCRSGDHHNAGGDCGCGGGSDHFSADGTSEVNSSKTPVQLSQNTAILALAMINIAAMCFITVIALKK